MHFRCEGPHLRDNGEVTWGTDGSLSLANGLDFAKAQ